MTNTTQPVPSKREKLQALLASAKSTSISASSFERWARLESKGGR
jgi:hypothetical protein